MSWGTAKTTDRKGKSWEYMNTRTWEDTLNNEIDY